MPRLRKPPKEEIQILPDEAPLTESVDIEIDDVESPVEIQLSETTTPPAEEDDPVKRALDATKRAEELQRSLAEAQRQRDALERQAHARDQEIVRERASAEDAQYNSVLTAIAAEQAALEKAEADYAAFANAGDWQNAARAQRIMATASARVDRLEDNKQAFEARREDVKRNPPQQRTPEQTPDQQISSLPIPDKAKSWLRSHPELMADTGKRARLNSVHGYLINNKGISEFSEDYFDALDAEFGFKASPTATTSEPPARRSMPVSAPVSREPPTPSGQRNTSTRVTLTPAERDIARNSFGPVKGANGEWVDMTNEQKERLYAMNKQKLQRLRSSGEYRHTTEQTG